MLLLLMMYSQGFLNSKSVSIKMYYLSSSIENKNISIASKTKNS